MILLCFFWFFLELARELDLGDKINLIRVENPNSLQDQSHTLLKLWTEKEGNQATGQKKLDNSCNNYFIKRNKKKKRRKNVYDLHSLLFCVNRSFTYQDIDKNQPNGHCSPHRNKDN